MAEPVRLRLSRARGFDLQAFSRATNGLPATVVARPSRWGNPYRIAPAYSDALCTLPEITPELAVSLFRDRWRDMLETWPSARERIGLLRGRNLACWCAAGAPCHADVLLELAKGAQPVEDAPRA